MPRLITPLLLSWRSIPELRHVPGGERETFWKRAVAGSGTLWEQWVIAAGAIAGMLASARIGRLPSKAPLWSTSSLSYVLIGIIWLTVWHVANVNVAYRHGRARLRSLLRAARRCPSCGYDLRRGPARCPECGASRQAPAC